MNAKLTKSEEKRFHEKFVNHGEFVYNKGGYPVVCSELKQYLADELARERKCIVEDIKKMKPKLLTTEDTMYTCGLNAAISIVTTLEDEPEP